MDETARGRLRLDEWIGQNVQVDIQAPDWTASNHGELRYKSQIYRVDERMIPEQQITHMRACDNGTVRLALGPNGEVAVTVSLTQGRGV